MPRESRGFRYQPRSKESIKERANMRGGDFDSIYKSNFPLFKPKEGKNIIRICPPTWEGAKHYGLDIYVNYNIGADNQSYLSLSKMKNERDPLAEARREAERNGDKDLSKALRPTQRILFWVIDRNNEDEGPLLWGAPFTFDKDLANISFDEDTREVVFIDDPENGNDIKFYREGTGLKTTYDASRMKIMPEGPLSDDPKLMKEWLDFIQDNPLPDVLNYYDYDHINGVFGGQAGRRDEEDADAPRKPAARTRPSDDEDEDAPRRPNASRKPVDDDDDPPPRSARKPVIEETEEDPDEDPAPPRKSGSIRERLATRRREADPPFDAD